MKHPSPTSRCLLALTACLLTALTACAPKPTTPTPAEADSSVVTPSEPPTPKPQAQASYLTLNLEAGTIDLAARMVHAKPDWLELIATTEGPNSRDHEAIVSITAKPSEVHLALLTLGLMPGHPQVNKHMDGRFVPDPAIGPELRVYFVYEINGQTVQTPVHQWVTDQATGQPLPETRWLFTGSQFRQWQGKEYYMADENGNAVSLVNFGDDLIVRQTDTTQNNDEQQLQLNPNVILPYGTPLILRIRVTSPAPAEAVPSAVNPQQTPAVR